MMEVFTGFSKMVKCSQEKVWLARNELKQAVNPFVSEPSMKQHGSRQATNSFYTRTTGCHFPCIFYFAGCHLIDTGMTLSYQLMHY
jgi:hypothetical protein